MAFPLLAAAAAVAIRCSAPDVPIRSTAEYSPVSPGVAPTLMVTFASRPTSTQAEAVLRACIAAAAKTHRIGAEMLANAWVGEDGPLTLPDGSNHLSYDPKTGGVKTWNEREGVKPKVESVAGGAYFTEYKEQKVLVPPYGKFATVNVVFTKPPTEAAALAAVVRELQTAVKKQTPLLHTTGYAMTGRRSDPASQEQIRARNGKYIVLEFDPKSGQITFWGKLMGSMAR